MNTDIFMSKEEIVETLNDFVFGNFEIPMKVKTAINEAVCMLEAKDKTIIMSTWNPIRWREMTKEEQESFPDWTMITDDPLPDSGEPVLVTVRWTHYITGELHYDVVADEWDEETGSWDSNDTDDVVAWMPMIEPYKGGGQNNKDVPVKRKFLKLISRSVPDEIIPYPEYKGKPYYEIMYEEDGEEFVGFGTYKIDILSEFIRDYFIGNGEKEPMSEEKTDAT